MKKSCELCGAPLICNADAANESCWCVSMAPARLDDKISDCLCKSCLTKNQPDSYRNEHGLMVMTEAYLLKQGKCCNNGCKHCPY